MHRRVVVAHYGGPDELRIVEEECPEPKRGEDERPRIVDANAGDERRREPEADRGDCEPQQKSVHLVSDGTRSMVLV